VLDKLTKRLLPGNKQIVCASPAWEASARDMWPLLKRRVMTVTRECMWAPAGPDALLHRHVRY
jgi:hypothetical protein